MADETRKRKNWQVPPYSPSGANKRDVHEFMIQSVEDGKEFLDASPGHQQLEDSIRILSGKPTKALKQKIDEGYSDLIVNHVKRNLKEMVNSLAEIRWNPGFKTTDNKYKKTSELLNNVSLAWYLDTFVDLKIKKAIQWMAICPCGWLEISFRRLPGDHGRAEIDAIPHSWFDVVMTGVPESGDHQEAYTVTIIKDWPVYYAHAIWPDHQKILIPDRETPKGWLERTRAKVEKVIRDTFSPSQEPDKSTAKNPTCRLYYQYVLDLAVNRSGETMKMGYEKQIVKDASGANKQELISTPWSYDVPSVGKPVLRGYKINSVSLLKEPYYTMATVEECRIFPGRRLLVGNDQDMIYDGPMHDWHGRVPLVKFAGDSWVFGEFSMLHDLVSPHEVVQEIDRMSHQTARNRMNPTILYNLRAVDKPKAAGINSVVQGDRIGYNGGEVQDARKAVDTLFSTAFNTIEPWMGDLRKYLLDQIDYISGKPNFAALAKSKMQNAAGDDASDKILQDAGPIVRGIGRDMERSMRDFSDMFKYMVFQYKTSPELAYVVGEDMMTPESFDLDPGNLVPAHLPGEDRKLPSVYTKMQRARWMAEHIKFIMLPGTLHEIVQMQQRLVYMNLWQKGFPIDPMTLSETLRLGNWGTVEGSTMKERYFNWKEEEMEMMIRLKKRMEELTGEGGEPGENAGKLGKKGGQLGTGGRPSTGQKPPQIKQKGDGRVVNTES